MHLLSVHARADPVAPCEAQVSVLVVEEIRSPPQPVARAPSTVRAAGAPDLQAERNEAVGAFLRASTPMVRVYQSCWSAAACDSFWVDPRAVDVRAVRAAARSYQPVAVNRAAEILTNDRRCGWGRLAHQARRRVRSSSS